MKYQLLCNKMSKVENSYKRRLKAILKQHHVNVNRTQILMLMYANFDFHSRGQICIYAKFVYMQTEICTWSQWCKFCIRVQIRSHGQICTREYICIYANIRTRMHICPCECTFSRKSGIIPSIIHRMLG